MATRRILLVGFALIAFFLLNSLAIGYELEQLHRDMQKKRARWTAGETSMTRLPQGERHRRLGLIRPTFTGTEPMVSQSPPETQVPAGFDWRNNGGNYVTPVRDQGSCGSCWAFGTAAALEASILISNRTPGIDLNLSEQVMISCGGVGSCAGGSIGSASNFIQNTGLPKESCYPYTSTNGYCPNACPSWQSSTSRISSWKYVATTYPTLDGIRNALFNYGPLVTTMAVYNDFFSYRSGIYSYVSGGFAGYHAVLIVGYDDANQYFTVKNSWGSSWGESGYFRIGYSELFSPVGFGDWTIAYVGAAPVCSYSISPYPSSFPAAGGNGSAAVNTQGSCSWTAVSNSSWITVTSTASGSGSGSASFWVQPNTAGYRTGTLTIAGQTFTISQDAGIPPCSYSLNPTVMSHEAAGGGGSVAVYAGAGCPWTASSNAGWITIAGVSAGAGNGAVAYSVASNTSLNSRTGTLTIAGRTFTVSQSGSSHSRVVLAMNCGGGEYVDSAGVRYLSDRYYSGGRVGGTAEGIAGTEDDAPYQTERYGNYSYAIPLANGNYQVLLKFAEFYWSSPGRRVFDVWMQGRKVLSSLDILALVGKNRAYDVSFPAAVTDGNLHIAVKALVDYGKISAIVITETEPSGGVVFAMNSGGGQYVDGSGVVYQADRYYGGGWTGSTPEGIAGTGDSPLYQTERYGNYSYAIPVGNGDYEVQLKFTEYYWSSPGRRVFDVWVQGTRVLKNLDLFGMVGKNRAYDVSFPVTVTDGYLYIGFDALVDYGKLSALVIRRR